MFVLVLQLIDVWWVYIGLHCKQSLFCPRCDGLGRRGLAVGSCRREMVENWSPDVLYRRRPERPELTVTSSDKWHPFESSANSESSQHMSNCCNKLCKRTFKIFKSGISLNFGQCSSTVNLDMLAFSGIFRGWIWAARHASPSEACEWNLPWSLSQYYKLWTKEWLATHWMVIGQNIATNSPFSQRATAFNNHQWIIINNLIMITMIIHKNYSLKSII